MKYLYKITNKINGKTYIGQTTNFKKRIHNHIHTKSSSLIHMAILKYGKDNFKYEILFKRPYNFIDVAETVAIKYYNSLVPNGYNLESGGCVNKKHNQNTKDKMSTIKKGKKQLKISLARKNKPHPHKGVPCAPKTKLKMSLANKGAFRTAEQKLKMSLAQKDRFKNNQCTAETKLKLSIALLGRTPWNKSKPMTDEQKIKCSLANKGKKLSEAHKTKISLAVKTYYIQQKLKKEGDWLDCQTK